MTQKLKELREKQARIVSEARERLDQIDTADEARAKELELAHDTAMAEHDRLERQIEREQRLIDLEKRQEEQRAKQRPAFRHEAAFRRRYPVRRQYRVPFRFRKGRVRCLAVRSHGRRACRAAYRHDRFRNRTQTGSVAGAGGYTVPTELAAQIIKSMKAWGPMYDEDICTVISTVSGNPMTVPSVDDTGKEAAARTEGDALLDDNSGDVVFGQKLLGAYSFATPFIKWSFELDADSIFNMESLLGSLIGERLGRIANRRLTTGTGADAPQGAASGAALGVTTATATAFTWDNVIDLEHSVDPAYRASPRCRYMMHDTTLQAARKLKDGQGNYLWQKGDVQKGIPTASTVGPIRSISTWTRSPQTSVSCCSATSPSSSCARSGLRHRRAARTLLAQVGIAGLIRFDSEIGDAAAIKAMQTAA